MIESAVIHSRALHGVLAPVVRVEVHLSAGYPNFAIVGLPEVAIKESRERVRSALLHNRFDFPDRHITVNLAPADLPKQGSRFDLPIAIGILIASKQLQVANINEYELAGELSLQGDIRPCRGIVNMAIATQKAKRSLIVAEANAYDATWVDGLQVYPVKHLLDVFAHLTEQQRIEPLAHDMPQLDSNALLDFSDVHGHFSAKRALEVAAAGHHHVLMVGPPGVGKTLLASRFTSILPPLNTQQALDVAAIYSLTEPAHFKLGQRPFRMPHHTASAVALVGGGNPPQPGEISKAHHGVLFLDELPEFQRMALDALREPLESNKISIARAARYVEFPADIQLIAAMNPCVCGYFGHIERSCRCSPEQMKRYRHKISGPLLDRIDLQLEISAVPLNELHSQSEQAESSATILDRVMQCQQLQYDRQACLNQVLSVQQLSAVCQLSHKQQHWFVETLKKLQCGPRSYHRILKVARTIADLDKATAIETEHLLQALQYRRLDKYF